MFTFDNPFEGVSALQLIQLIWNGVFSDYGLIALILVSPIPITIWLIYLIDYLSAELNKTRLGRWMERTL